MPTEYSPIIVHENGDESHESWIKIGANRISSSPGAWLFDSDIPHQHFIRVTIERCVRKRDLNRDWLFNKETLIKVDMSQAQWGAFVSSFGRGGGVPATLNFLQGVGLVPQAPPESRLNESHREVKEAGKKALSQVQAAYEAVQTAFDENKGKKAMREALRNLSVTLGNAPANMEFAAKSLTEHVENVVTKARADIEGTVIDAIQHGELDANYLSQLQLGPAQSDVTS